MVAGRTAHGENCFLAFFPGSKTVHRNPAQLLQQQLKWAVGYKLLTKYPVSVLPLFRCLQPHSLDLLQ